LADLVLAALVLLLTKLTSVWLPAVPDRRTFLLLVATRVVFLVMVPAAELGTFLVLAVLALSLTSLVTGTGWLLLTL
jgi:hypothetical protein